MGRKGGNNREDASTPRRCKARTHGSTALGGPSADGAGTTGGVDEGGQPVRTALAERKLTQLEERAKRKHAQLVERSRVKAATAGNSPIRIGVRTPPLAMTDLSKALHQAVGADKASHEQAIRQHLTTALRRTTGQVIPKSPRKSAAIIGKMRSNSKVQNA
eukprot:369633-Prymnesium_polylepis.1